MTYATEELWSPYTETQSSSGTAPDSTFLHPNDLALFDARIRRPIGFGPRFPQETPMSFDIKNFVRHGRENPGAFDVSDRLDGLVEVDILPGFLSERVVAIESFASPDDLGIASFTPAQARDLAAVILAAADLADKP